jgi:hypothetical protein
MLIEKQDEIIDMLEKLRDHKQYVRDEGIKLSLTYETTRQQLSQFSTRALSSGGAMTDDMKMEIDSMASTPLAQ